MNNQHTEVFCRGYIIVWFMNNDLVALHKVDYCMHSGNENRLPLTDKMFLIVY